MPRNTREWALRKLDYAEGNVTTARKHIAEVTERYEETEPGIAGNLLALDTMLLEMSKLILQVRSSI